MYMNALGEIRAYFYLEYKWEKFKRSFKRLGGITWCFMESVLYLMYL